MLLDLLLCGPCRRKYVARLKYRLSISPRKVHMFVLLGMFVLLMDLCQALSACTSAVRNRHCRWCTPVTCLCMRLCPMCVCLCVSTRAVFVWQTTLPNTASEKVTTDMENLIQFISFASCLPPAFSALLSVLLIPSALALSVRRVCFVRLAAAGGWGFSSPFWLDLSRLPPPPFSPSGCSFCSSPHCPTAPWGRTPSSSSARW